MLSKIITKKKQNFSVGNSHIFDCTDVLSFPSYLKYFGLHKYVSLMEDLVIKASSRVNKEHRAHENQRCHLLCLISLESECQLL